jgi:Sec-independent protein translocase protein TatA
VEFAFSELCLVFLIALMVLGPKEALEFVKAIRKGISEVKLYYKKYTDHLNAILSESENVIDVMIDENGQIQKMYNLDKIKPDIKDEEVING